MQSAAPAAEHLVFENPGALEINLVKLLGVSVKETNDPIGFFGTGLKYAMAAAMRLGGSMTIITDGIRHEVGGVAITLRDKAFTQVTLSGEPLGFTTELGKQWEPWMVVRELYSNALDEGGSTRLTASVSDQTTATRDRTLIILGGDCFTDVWHHKEQYFIDSANQAPLLVTPHAEVYASRNGCRSVFYRGINVRENTKPLLYRYNVTDSVILTEDRTLKYDFQFHNAVERSIATADDRTYVYQSLTAPDDYLESSLSFGDGCASVNLSETFKEVCGDLLRNLPATVNRGALRLYQARTSAKEELVPAQLSAVQTKQLAKAVGFVRDLGCYDLDDFPLHVVRWLGEGTYGRAEDGVIHLSVDCFDKGTKFVASTLFEEYVHCKYGFEDESRALQTWLFDRVVTMGEEYITGEPL